MTRSGIHWEQLVQEQENRLYRAALAILGNAQEAEDAVQDAFLAFWSKAPEDVREPGAWLMRVLVNRCRSCLRSAWRRETLPLWERSSLSWSSSMPSRPGTGRWSTCSTMRGTPPKRSPAC